MHRLSLVVTSRGSSPSQCAGFSLRWLLLLRAQAQQLWLPGLVAPRHVESSQTGVKPMSLLWRAHSSPLGHQESPNLDVLVAANSKAHKGRADTEQESE